MEWGSKREFLESITTEDYIPTALENVPEFFEWMEEYLEAFDILHKSRSFNDHGPNPISLVDMDVYIRLRGVSDTDEFLHIIRKMDDVFMELYRMQLEKKLKMEKSKNVARRK